MNTLDEMSTDAGLALLAEQQAWLQAARDGASWGESGYFLQLDIHGEPDLQRLQAALDNCLQRQSARPCVRYRVITVCVSSRHRARLACH
jgi:hypothetical protein